jgi:hypothetical protein
MTIQRFLARWWRQLVAILLVMAAVVGYGLARGGGANGEFSASPPASSAPDPAEPTTGSGAAGGRGGVTASTGDAPTDPDNPDGPGTGTRVTASSTTTTEPTTRTSRSEHWAIRWILSLGPDGPTSPIFYIEPYLRLHEHKCAEALATVDANDYFEHRRSGAVYRGAATACLAAFHQQPQRWIEARRSLAAAQSSTEDLNCPERVTLAWLQQVVGFHEQDPDRTFVAQEPQGFYTGIERLDPDHGPPGKQVRVKGSNLHCANEIEVTQAGSKPKNIPVTHDPSGSLTFTAPDGFSPGQAKVTLLNTKEIYTIGDATFTYDEAGGAGSSPDSSAGG